MKDYSAQYPKDREMKEWWYVSDWHDVIRVQGFSCAPSNDYWWCPQVGYSCAEGHSLFERKEDAIKAALANAQAVKVQVNNAIDKLTKMQVEVNA